MARESAPRKTADEDRMDFRLHREHKALIERAAALSGVTLTGFAVATLVSEARRVVREHEVTTLSNGDRDRFLALLDDPPPAAEALRRAARRHRELIVESE
jgi:uncharacterized protein (DUF1778 family)